MNFYARKIDFLYTKKEHRPAFRYRLKKKGENDQVRFVTVVAPYENEKPKIKVDVIGKPKTGSDNIQLEITENGKIKRIGYSIKHL